MTILRCPCCDEPCGKEYPPNHTDPGFREGKGEEFPLKDGRWCCSQFCLDAMNGEYDDDDGPRDQDHEPDFRTPDRDEWKHQAAAWQRLK